MPANARPQKVQKLLQRNYKKAIAKRFQKSYNMVTARASSPAECEIFFFLLSVDIGCAAHPPPAVLLRSCWPRTAQAVSSLRVQKSSPFGAGFFASPGPRREQGKADFGNKVLLSVIFLDKVSGFREESFGKFVLQNACVCAGLCYNKCKQF